MDADIVAQLAPTGRLRVGLNMANSLLITGTTPEGEPDGVAPDMGRGIAERLGVPVSLVQFASPGEIADSAGDNIWDIGLIGAEPARAEVMDFTAAYVEIEATYLVPEASPFQTVEEVDSKGTRIAISGRSAYDLYLTRALKNAELVRSQGISGAVEIFTNDKLDALAGLRPALVSETEKLPGTRILDGKFTAVQQAIGVQKGKSAAAQFLAGFVEEAKASGLVATLIEHHGVVGRLSVAAADG
jgi:polar amino acid transport system substrate-binding protein